MTMLRVILEKSPRMVRKMIRQLEFGETTQRGDPPAGQNIRFVADHFCTGHKLGKVTKQLSTLQSSSLSLIDLLMFIGDVWHRVFRVSQRYWSESRNQGTGTSPVSLWLNLARRLGV